MEAKIKDSKQEKIKEFDPNGHALDNGQLFGLPFNFEESAVAILPIPWEVTVSYNHGTSFGARAILEASLQVDLYDSDLPDAWKYGIYMLEISKEWINHNNRLRPRALEIQRLREKGEWNNTQIKNSLATINQICEDLEDWIFEQTQHLVNHGKLVGLLGGEHSVPLGFLKCLANKYKEFGVLQIDAHADLREAYEGFEQSHASIMHNALKIPNITKLTQVGLRDYCEAEKETILNSEGRISAFSDHQIKRNIFEGRSWSSVVHEIIDTLPKNVYISFDIDGLDPKLCPNTGTPVPGGFEIQEVNYLIRELVNSGRRIIGFDLVEVAPGKDDWDGNVGARLLYKLSNLMIKSRINEGELDAI